MYSARVDIKQPDQISGKHNNPFFELLKSKVNQLETPYALACVFKSSDSSATDGKQMCDGLHSNVKKVLGTATDSEFDLVIDNNAHFAIILRGSCLNNTSQLIRIVRNHLTREYPSHTLSIAAAHVTTAQINIDQLLSDICVNLTSNIEEGSSRIEVKHF